MLRRLAVGIIFSLIGFAPAGSAAEFDDFSGVRELRQAGGYTQAEQLCHKLLERSEKDSESYKSALFELAACYQFDTRRHTYTEAVKLYRRFIREFPGDYRCAQACFLIGRCYDAFSTSRSCEIEKAREAYKSCYENYPRSPWAEEAFFWHANSFIYCLSRENAAQSTEMFEEFLQRFPASQLTGVVHSQLSELYCAWLDNYEAAVKHSEAALAFGLEDIDLKRVHFYRLGYLCQFKLNDKSRALYWYRKLRDESSAKSDPNYFVAQKRCEALDADVEAKP